MKSFYESKRRTKTKIVDTVNQDLKFIEDDELDPYANLSYKESYNIRGDNKLDKLRHKFEKAKSENIQNRIV